MSRRSLFLALSLWTATAWAQVGGGGGIVLRGEIENEGSLPLGEKYVVQVSECSEGGDLGRTSLGFDNRFEFRDLKAGCKIVRILSSDERRLLHEERVLAQNDNVPLVIHLRNEKPGSGKVLPASSAGTVSADGLRHPIPPKVLQALTETQRLSEAGRTEEAASKLQKVVEHNPNVWQAHLNLGALKMKLGRPAEALASFVRARELEPRSSMAALDSAIALVVLRRITEAEGAAREALKLDPSNQNAQMILDRLRTGRARGIVKDAPED
jgi:tetratricopeptide (TPR) repeat protein